MDFVFFLVITILKKQPGGLANYSRLCV